MFCSSCGATLVPGATFCPQCGKAATAVQPTAPQPVAPQPAAPQPAVRPAAPAYGAPAKSAYPTGYPVKNPLNLNALMAFIFGITGAVLGLAFTIVSIVLLAGDADIEGIGSIFISMGVTLGLCISAAGLSYGIGARKNKDKSSFSLIGIICGGSGALLAILSLIFLLVVAA